MRTKFREFTGGTDDTRVEVLDETEAAEAQPVPSQRRLGRRLAQARLAQGLTQRAVAKLAHIDQGQVSEVERGVGNPTLRILTAMAGAVGLEVDLRGGRSRPPPEIEEQTHSVRKLSED